MGELTRGLPNSAPRRLIAPCRGASAPRAAGLRWAQRTCTLRCLSVWLPGLGLDFYGPHFSSLLRQNISYTPIVWSAYGRHHQNTLTTSRSLSKSTTRKRNFVSVEVVFQRLHSRITLEIWKRSAWQTRSCWPSAALPAPLESDHQSEARASWTPLLPPFQGVLLLPLLVCACLQPSSCVSVPPSCTSRSDSSPPSQSLQSVPSGFALQAGCADRFR